MMENNKKETNLVVAGLKLSKSEIGEAAGNEKNTRLAAALIAFSVILDTVIAYFKGGSGSSGLGRMGLTGFNAAFAEMGSALIGTFLSVFIMVYVLRIFKVKPSYAGILRVYGAAIIWTIMGAVLGLILPEKFALAGILFWLAYNFSLMFGLTGYTKIKTWQSFLGIVITFAVIFGIVILYGTVIKSILG
jgi:hypothetical protein